MKKLLFMMMCAFVLSTSVNAKTLVPLTVTIEDDTPLGNGNSKSPDETPTVYIDDYTLYFEANHPEYDINNDKINTDKSEQEPWNLEVYNLQNGRIAFKTDVKDNIYYLNTSKWEQGNYIIRAILGDEVYTKKIRVE